MTTYSLRCRNSACRHRRVATRHPDEYERVPACPVCGSKAGWRIEQRAYNQRGLCYCNGPDLVRGQHFPHRTTHPYCDNHPHGFYNQARAKGVPHEDIPPEYWPDK